MKLELPSARELPAPGPRAYFCHATKVSKNALEPTVQDSHYGGYCFLRLSCSPSGLNRTAGVV